MIAWWIWLGRQIAGDTPLGVRLLPVLASAVDQPALVFDLARLAGAGRRAAGAAGVWFNATLLVLRRRLAGHARRAGQPVLDPRRCGARLRAARGPAGLVAGGRRRRRAWRACRNTRPCSWPRACCSGCCCRREGRGQLRTPGPWLAAADRRGPVRRQRGLERRAPLADLRQAVRPRGAAPLRAAHFIEFLGAQFAAAQPADRHLRRGRRHVAGAGRRPAVELMPFVAIGAPFAAYLLIHSLHDRVQAHWPAPLYPMVAICAAVGAERLGDRSAWRRLATAGPGDRLWPRRYAPGPRRRSRQCARAV